jgi:hypothetical protein
MPDELMELLRQTAILQFGAPSSLPLSLNGNPLREATKRRAEFLRIVQKPLSDHGHAVLNSIPGPNYPAQCADLAVRLRGETNLTAPAALFLDDVADADARISISLRLYAGYLDTAKVIAWGVRGRKNTAATRNHEITAIVEAKAVGDCIYEAGIEAAPHYKWRCLGENIFSEGIPPGSIVLRDWND